MCTHNKPEKCSKCNDLEIVRVTACDDMLKNINDSYNDGAHKLNRTDCYLKCLDAVSNASSMRVTNLPDYVDIPFVCDACAITDIIMDSIMAINELSKDTNFEWLN